MVSRYSVKSFWTADDHHGPDVASGYVSDPLVRLTSNGNAIHEESYRTGQESNPQVAWSYTTRVYVTIKGNSQPGFQIIASTKTHPSIFPQRTRTSRCLPHGMKPTFARCQELLFNQYASTRFLFRGCIPLEQRASIFLEAINRPFCSTYFVALAPRISAIAVYFP